MFSRNCRKPLSILIKNLELRHRPMSRRKFTSFVSIAGLVIVTIVPLAHAGTIAVLQGLDKTTARCRDHRRAARSAGAVRRPAHYRHGLRQAPAGRDARERGIPGDRRAAARCRRRDQAGADFQRLDVRLDRRRSRRSRTRSTMSACSTAKIDAAAASAPAPSVTRHRPAQGAQLGQRRDRLRARQWLRQPFRRRGQGVASSRR